MKPRVIVYRRVHQQVLDYLSEECEIIQFKGLDTITVPKFYEELRSAQGLLGAGLKVDKELLELAPELKIVSNISVGYDNLDLMELKRRHILATNTPGVLVDSTADAVFSLILSTARRVAELDSFVKLGKWNKVIAEDQFGVDVHHKVLGIIGMGSIGKAVAKRAHLGFDMQILYHNRSRNLQVEKDYQAVYCEMDDLLSRSDFVLIMTPHTPETDKMIGERELKLMKRNAIFINGSRGKNVDEEALVKALKNGWVRSAGLDVYDVEPIPQNHPLLSLPNTVTLPHIGSATEETRQRMAMLAAENLIAGLKGAIPPNLIKGSLP